MARPFQCFALLRSVHWRAPTRVVLCLFGGITLALTHHVLSLHLHGMAVTDLSLTQPWVIRVSSALAYLVKVLLVVSAGAAYFQCVWQEARKTPTSIGHFDSMFGALDNVFEFSDLRFWLRRPVLTLTATIVWYVSLSPLLSPSSSRDNDLPPSPTPAHTSISVYCCAMQRGIHDLLH